MARNPEKDKQAEQARRRQLLDAGLSLFSQKGIEGVSLQEIVNKTDVGIATMYNYYQNKENFVVAISADMWAGFLGHVLEKANLQQMSAMSLYDLTELYCDMIIDLYCSRPEILRFSSKYKTYICRQKISKESVQPHLNVLEPIEKIYHHVFEREKENGNILPDICEEALFRNTALTMLVMAERYAEGIVWIQGSQDGHLEDLRHVKEMVLLWCNKHIRSH